MARTGTAELHRTAQAGLAAAAARLIAHAWASLLDPHDLKGSTPRLAAAIQAILSQYGRASAAAGLTYYRNERRAAGVAGRPHLTMPTLPSGAEITATVEHVLTPLYGNWTPEALTPGAVLPVVETAGSAPQALETNLVTPETVQSAQDALASELEQMVLDQSRLAVMNASEVDKAAKGWARVTEPDACSFCRLLATRGAVYGSKSTADFRAHTKQPNGSGGTCRCHAEPVFHNYEPTAQARQDLIDYQKLAEEYGHSGRAIHVAWRQHVEGRPVTGPLTKPYARPAK